MKEFWRAWQKNLDYLEYIISTNVDVNNSASEDSKESEACVMRKWKKRCPCYIAAESWVELCPEVMWKAEIVNTKIGHIAKRISMQGLKMWPYFLLAFMVKCKRHKLR